MLDIEKRSIWSAVYGIIVYVLNYTHINIESFTVLAILMALDCLTGIARVWVLKTEDITSKRLANGVIKKIWTLFLPAVISLMIKTATDLDPSMVMNWCLSALVLAEGYSAVQNITSIIQGKEIKEYDALTLVISTILKTLKQVFENVLNPKQ